MSCNKMLINHLKIIQCDFLDFCFRFRLSQLKCTYDKKITDLYMLCKSENLQNRQCIKYLFSPLYRVVIFCLVCLSEREREGDPNDSTGYPNAAWREEKYRFSVNVSILKNIYTKSTCNNFNDFTELKFI